MTTLSNHLPAEPASPTTAVPPGPTDPVEVAVDDLLRMARLITGNDVTARSIVSAVLHGARRPIEAPAEPPWQAEDTHSALVAATFGACRRSLEAEAPPTAPRNESIDWMVQVSDRQRSAVALYLHGKQTPAQISSLLGMPLRAVCLLLLSALDEFAAAGATARPH